MPKNFANFDIKPYEPPHSAVTGGPQSLSGSKVIVDEKRLCWKRPQRQRQWQFEGMNPERLLEVHLGNVRESFLLNSCLHYTRTRTDNVCELGLLGHTCTVKTKKNSFSLFHQCIRVTRIFEKLSSMLHASYISPDSLTKWKFA